MLIRITEAREEVVRITEAREEVYRMTENTIIEENLIVNHSTTNSAQLVTIAVRDIRPDGSPTIRKSMFATTTRHTVS